MAQTILRLPQVEARTGYKRSSIYRLVKSGDFPPQIRLGGRASGWLEQEIDEWIAARVRVSRQQ